MTRQAWLSWLALLWKDIAAGVAIAAGILILIVVVGVCAYAARYGWELAG